MRIFFVVTLLLLVSMVPLSCESTGSAGVELEAGPDQIGAPACTSNADCASGLDCAFFILSGCGAKGECQDLGPDAGRGECVAATTLCGCDGKSVLVPYCWDNYAPAPVLPSALPCGSD